MLELDQSWTSTGSSGGLAAIDVRWPPVESVLLVQYSTLATTQSVSLQVAQDSTGPWAIEASTQISTTGTSTQIALRVTGPYGFVRPYLHTASTGAYQFRLIGVS